MFTIETTDETVDGPPGPPKTRAKVNILLVGGLPSDADGIRRELSVNAEVAYCAYHAADPEEAFAFIRRNRVQIGIIFLDLGFSSTRYPKDCFRQLRQSVPHVPIVVLTDRKDVELQRFVMEEGAADNVSQGQLRGDPGRLRNIVESSLAREKIARRERDQSAEDVDISRAQGDAVLKNAAQGYAINLRTVTDKSDAILKYAQDKGALDLKKLSEENKSLRRENDYARIALYCGYSVSRPGAKDALGANENKTPE